MKKIDWLSYAGHLVILFVFLIASAIYFFPALEGKIVYAGDNINGKAAVQESAAFHQQTGEYSFWTGSMFSGMPNYQIGGNGGYIVDKMFKPLRWFFMWGNRNAAFIFLFYLCAFCASIEILWLKIYNRCILLYLLEGHFETINNCDLMLKNITLNGRAVL